MFNLERPVFDVEAGRIVYCDRRNGSLAEITREFREHPLVEPPQEKSQMLNNIADFLKATVGERNGIVPVKQIAAFAASDICVANGKVYLLIKLSHPNRVIVQAVKDGQLEWTWMQGIRGGGTADNGRAFCVTRTEELVVPDPEAANKLCVYDTKKGLVESWEFLEAPKRQRLPDTPELLEGQPQSKEQPVEKIAEPPDPYELIADPESKRLAKEYHNQAQKATKATGKDAETRPPVVVKFNWPVKAIGSVRPLKDGSLLVVECGQTRAAVIQRNGAVVARYASESAQPLDRDYLVGSGEGFICAFNIRRTQLILMDTKFQTRGSITIPVPPLVSVQESSGISMRVLVIDDSTLAVVGFTQLEFFSIQRGVLPAENSIGR